ncbi:hypothetical protein Bca52824_003992 [Brassica carinata]|uniref:Uncharacterized protein n=1 Tax=Brassica carinata TaxID=52824 RepID=A0A8X8BF55_BRACI|nr:hypothetical protein Bca52824_003992 [Brassica carinata]
MKMMPTLVYDETSPYNGSLGFDQFCGMSLPLHEALKTLNIKLVNYYDDTLLFPNIRCSTLLEMTINIVNSYSRIRLPNNLKAFKTLLVLKLHSPIDLDVVDSPVCFPSLKSLHLTSVKFELKDSGVGDVLMLHILRVHQSPNGFFNWIYIFTTQFS